MKIIEQLISENYSEDVPFKELGEILDYEQPNRYLVKSASYDDSYNTPVLTAGETFLLGYTNETDGIYPPSQENPSLFLMISQPHLNGLRYLLRHNLQLCNC